MKHFKEILSEAKFLDTINNILKKFEKNFDVYPDDMVSMKKKGNIFFLYFKDSSIGDDFLASSENEKDILYIQKESNKLIEKTKRRLKK